MAKKAVGLIDYKIVVLAEFIGWKPYDRRVYSDMWISPSGKRFQSFDNLPNPYADANADYAYLEFARNEFHLNKGGKVTEEWSAFVEHLCYLPDRPNGKPWYEIGHFADALYVVIEAMDEE